MRYSYSLPLCCLLIFVTCFVTMLETDLVDGLFFFVVCCFELRHIEVYFDTLYPNTFHNNFIHHVKCNIKFYYYMLLCFTLAIDIFTLK